MIAIRNTPWEEILAFLYTDHAPNWESAEGPDSRVGVDYYYVNDIANKQAWINMDQDQIKIQITDQENQDPESDGFTWEGNQEELNVLLPKFHRTSVQTEELQDSSKTSASILNLAEVAAAKHIFQKFDLISNTEELTTAVLYTIDIGTEDGGTYEELRTADEVLEILQTQLRIKKEDAVKIFQKWTKTGESISDYGADINLDETRIQPILDSQEFADVITDPDKIGTSSYRAAAELATTVAEIGLDPTEVDDNHILNQENLQAI